MAAVAPTANVPSIRQRVLASSGRIKRVKTLDRLDAKIGRAHV